jgi:hypothetical protein
MDLCLELRLLGEGVERLENYVHVELSEVTCCLTPFDSKRKYSYVTLSGAIAVLGSHSSRSAQSYMMFHSTCLTRHSSMPAS